MLSAVLSQKRITIATMGYNQPHRLWGTGGTDLGLRGAWLAGNVGAAVSDVERIAAAPGGGAIHCIVDCTQFHDPQSAKDQSKILRILFKLLFKSFDMVSISMAFVGCDGGDDGNARRRVGLVMLVAMASGGGGIGGGGGGGGGGVTIVVDGGQRCRRSCPGYAWPLGAESQHCAWPHAESRFRCWFRALVQALVNVLRHTDRSA